MGKNFRETFTEQMKDPAFRAEWETQEPERQIIRAIIEGREEHDLTQKQLAEATGITQADISRLENGTANPSLSTLKRLAAGMGMKLQIEFVPALLWAGEGPAPADMAERPFDHVSINRAMINRSRMPMVSSVSGFS